MVLAVTAPAHPSFRDRNGLEVPEWKISGVLDVVECADDGPGLAGLSVRQGEKKDSILGSCGSDGRENEMCEKDEEAHGLLSSKRRQCLRFEWARMVLSTSWK